MSVNIDPGTLEALKAEAERLLSERQLELYRPYTKQVNFHTAGVSFRERLLMAGNQLGKSYCGAAELAMHATGRYPDWWQGRRFAKPIVAWAAGVTSESTRDNPQRLLVGRAGQHGTGMLPKALISDVTLARTIGDAVDTVQVKHASGGISRIGFKAYEKGREKLQGETLDVVWLDEEPPMDIYQECLTRTNATGGMVYITFTPLLGMSSVVRQFYPQPTSAYRHITQMTIDDAEHYSPEQRAAVIAGYSAHERDARAKGIPILGSGRVFPVPESAIVCAPFAIPKHYAQIGGLDFGWDHPTAAVRLAYDRDADVVYLTHEYRQSEKSIRDHADALKAWGDWLPWAWPHDGLQHDKGSGVTLAEQYRRAGLSMLPDRATFEDGGNGVEAGLMQMLDRMQTGRFKVFSTCVQWFEEFRLYHRKDGKVVKEQDDILSASRYALMMLRFATAGGSGWSRDIKYDDDAVRFGRPR